MTMLQLNCQTKLYICIVEKYVFLSFDKNACSVYTCFLAIRVQFCLATVESYAFFMRMASAVRIFYFLRRHYYER